MGPISLPRPSAARVQARRPATTPRGRPTRRANPTKVRGLAGEQPPELVAGQAEGPEDGDLPPSPPGGGGQGHHDADQGHRAEEAGQQIGDRADPFEVGDVQRLHRAEDGAREVLVEPFAGGDRVDAVGRRSTRKPAMFVGRLRVDPPTEPEGDRAASVEVHRGGDRGRGDDDAHDGRLDGAPAVAATSTVSPTSLSSSARVPRPRAISSSVARRPTLEDHRDEVDGLGLELGQGHGEPVDVRRGRPGRRQRRRRRGWPPARRDPPPGRRRRSSCRPRRPRSTPGARGSSIRPSRLAA